MVKNYKRLLRTVEAVGENVDVITVNAAVWKEEGDVGFITSGNRNSSVSSTASHQHKDIETHLATIDNIADGKVDFIKYDVEGAEYEALIGSEKTIRTNMPAMLVSVYHRSRDVFFLINYLSEKYDGYDFYMRRLFAIPAWETDLIMLPKDLKK